MNSSSAYRSASPIFAAKGLTKVFRTGTIESRVIQDVSFSVYSGEYLGISGPSGSGKSTLLSIVGLLEPPTRGTLRLGEYEPWSLSDRLRAKIRNQGIGYVFQSFHLISAISVLGNVELALRYRDGTSRSKRRSAAAEALERVGLENRMQHKPSQLSGGQQQRVAVARAIVGNPSILLADEPTGNLDSSNGEAIMGILDSLNASGTTILLVTHDPRYTDRASRTLSLRDGKLEEFEQSV